MLVALLQREIPLERSKRNKTFASLLRRFAPHTVFLQLGAGDCRLARLAASYVERVYAVDPIGNLAGGALPPGNLRLLRGADLGVAVPEGSVHPVFAERSLVTPPLERIHRLLAPGGVFLSTDRDLRPRLVAAGFAKVRFPWFEPLVEAIKG